jgi:hypothetical protein
VVAKDCTTESIIAHSADASLVFLPLSLKAGQIVDCVGKNADSLLPKLPLVALVVASQEIDLDAEPEEGAAGLLAEAEDKLNVAKGRVRSGEEDVLAANTEIEAALKALMDARQQGSDDEQVSKLYETLAKARQDLDKATRRSAKAEAKLEIEKQQLDQLRKKYHVNEDKKEASEEKAD